MISTEQTRSRNRELGITLESYCLTLVSPIANAPNNTITFTILYHFNHRVTTVKIFSFFFRFYFTILYWFCHTSTWICHGCTWVPTPEPPSHLPPHTISLGHPSAPAPSILYPASNLDWWFVSYMILHVSMPFSP